MPEVLSPPKPGVVGGLRVGPTVCAATRVGGFHRIAPVAGLAARPGIRRRSNAAIAIQRGGLVFGLRVRVTAMELGTAPGVGIQTTDRIPAGRAWLHCDRFLSGIGGRRGCGGALVGGGRHGGGVLFRAQRV
jgi:hypothetical protein